MFVFKTIEQTNLDSNLELKFQVVACGTFL